MPWRKILVCLLLFLLFTAGMVISGRFGRRIWSQRNVPYRHAQIKELENTLEQLDNSSEEQLYELETQLHDILSEQAVLKTQLADLNTLRLRELLRAAVADSDKIAKDLFTTQYFSDAYRQYLEDLLDAFLSDGQIHEWLYPYYAYSMKLGMNRYIADEMYFYTVTDDNSIFSEEIQEPDVLLKNTYNYDLDRHIYYTGRIYITASDFMNRVLLIPDYVANGAIFVKAFGGNPDPAKMRVPRWGRADYAAFWRDAPDFSDSRDPIWRYYGLSAEQFNLNWEQLANEQAFYDAYLKFMNTIAPGLGVFDMVTYSAGDDAFGGMYFDITGKEASVTEIVTLYVEQHPEYLEKIDLDPENLPSSFDEQITEMESEIELLTKQANDLAARRNEMAALLDNADDIRTEYERLMTDVQNRNNLILYGTVLFAGSFLMLFFMALISLITIILLIMISKHVIPDPTAQADPHT